jgi:uncharacterized protein
MIQIERTLQITLPAHQSAFLWGPRKTGKSTYLRSTHRSYRELGYGIHFWRTKSGFEVDFVLGDGEVAVEVKGTSRVDPADFRSLRAFIEDNRPRHAILVCNERFPRLVEGIEVLPWQEFLARLWGGRVLS